MSKKVIVIGAGFTGMSVAAYLAANGFEVAIFEKNDRPGLRARHYSAEGFAFDMGPSLYCNSEVVNNFLSFFHYNLSDYYSVKQVDPIKRIFFSHNNFIDIPSKKDELYALFHSLENNGDKKLKKYINCAETYYNSFFQKITGSFPKAKPVGKLRKLLVDNRLNKHTRYINRYFKNPEAIAILDHLLLYPGIVPKAESEIKFAINHSILTNGLTYPEGGILQLINAFQQILQEQKVLIYYRSSVESYDIIDNKITGIITNGKTFHADIFVSSTDYHYTEQILPKNYRNYSEKHWKIKKELPSVLIYFLGFDIKLQNFKPINTFLRGNNLNIQVSDAHIFVISPSKLDSSFAPENKESLIIRVIIPKGIEDTGKMREHYYEQTLKYLEQITGENLLDHVIYKKSYTKTDFEEDYNTYEGKDFRWLNTIYTAGKPKLKIRNQHIPNLFYAEQPTWLGADIPYALINGEIVANNIINIYSKGSY